LGSKVHKNLHIALHFPTKFIKLNEKVVFGQLHLPVSDIAFLFSSSVMFLQKYMQNGLDLS